MFGDLKSTCGEANNKSDDGDDSHVGHGRDCCLKSKVVISFIDHHGNHLILTYKGEKAGEKKDGHADHEGETRQHQHFPARFL